MSKAKEQAGATAKRPPAPVGAAANAALASKAALDGTRAAGKALSLLVSRARLPVLAGSAAAAGLAGGLAVLNRRRAGARRNGNIEFDRVLQAAQRLGSFGEEIGRVATVIQQVNQGAKSSK
jgi:hypothetical protein